MYRFLFLLAWVSGSEEACAMYTGVHSQDDLLREYMAGNKHVFAVEILVPDGGNEEEIASKYGYAEAFFDNYTAHGSISTTVRIADDFVHPGDAPKKILVNI